MKKLLVLAFVALLATSALAQLDDAFFYVGNVDGTDFMAGIDRDMLIPVYFAGGTENVWIADISYAMAGQVAVVQDWNPTASVWNYWPFNSGQFGWSTKEFGNLNDDANPTHPNDLGYISMTFTGFARTVFNDPDWLHSDVPIHILDYAMHTVADGDLIGQTICALQDGQDPQQGSPNVGDTLGGAGYNFVSQYSCLFFSPNQAPIIISVGNMPACTYTDFCIQVVIEDPDGDPLTVTSDYGTWTLTNTEYDGDAAYYTYDVCFDMEDFCGDCANFTFGFTVTDNINEPVSYTAQGATAIIGAITASFAPYTELVPGVEEQVPVYMDACGDCFCLGGFVFTFEWDASVFAVTDVERGTMLAAGEYWNVVYGVAGPGTARVTFINNLNNCQDCDPICNINPEEPLFFVTVMLDPEQQYDVGWCSWICFMYSGQGENHFAFNNVTDADGYHVWFNDGCQDPPDSTFYGTFQLNLECGQLVILDEHSVLRGDINANGYANDVGDVVLLANHLMDPTTYWFTYRQMVAADANMDGLKATIGDLIYMIHMLNGGGAAKVVPIDVAATITMPDELNGNLPVSVVSNASVGGAVVTINHPGVELGVPTANGMDLKYSDVNGVMTVVVYNMQSLSLAPGSNTLFTVPVLSEGSVSFGDVSVADGRGALLDSRTAITAPLPTEFSVSQNFPNPFNAQTGIKFELPTAANTTVSIYNVAGQLVKTFDEGPLAAGTYQVVWDASNVASGVYFYKVTAGDFTKTMKMTLLK